MIDIFIFLLFTVFGLVILALAYVIYDLLQMTDHRLRESIQRWMVRRTMQRLAKQSVR